MDYVSYCKNYFQATGIPVSLLQKSAPLYSSIGDLLQYPPTKTYYLYPQEHNPSFERLTPDLEYGHVHVENTDFDIILGPVFNVPVTDELLLAYMREQMIPKQYKEPLAEFFFSMPVISELGLLQHLSLIYLSLNHKNADTSGLYSVNPDEFDKQQKKHIHERMEKLENASIHNTYLYEIGLYECIKAGNEDRLIAHMEDQPVSLYEGRLALSPLRQAKMFSSALCRRPA